MTPITLDWIYCDNGASFDEKLKDKKLGEKGIYVWMIKNPDDPQKTKQIFYVGQGKLWKRNEQHFEESISGRWMRYCWGIGNENYMDFLSDIRKQAHLNANAKDEPTLYKYIDNNMKAKIELAKTDDQRVERGGNSLQTIDKDILDADKVSRRIYYINKYFSYAFAVVNDDDLKHIKAVESLLIFKLTEGYIKIFCPRPSEDFILAQKSTSKIETIKLVHGGDAKNLPEELRAIESKSIP